MYYYSGSHFAKKFTMNLECFKRWWLWIFLSTNFILLPQLDTAQILAILPIHAYSHQAYNQAIIKGLLSRGHNITVISYFKSTSPSPNRTDIVLEDHMKPHTDSIPADKVHPFNSVRDMFFMTSRIHEETCDKILKLDYIQRLTRSEEKAIDLIIVESYLIQCFNMLAIKLDIPVIVTSAVTTSIGHDLMLGNPSNPSYVPFVSAPVPLTMNFIQRLINTFQYTVIYFGHYWFFNTHSKRLAREYFNMNLPTTDALHNRVSVILCNNHFSIMNRPTVPNLIDIAGIHIQEPKPLPSEIQNFVDDAEHGVIFLSFGTNLKASTIPSEKLNMISQTFSKLPQRVLWRIDDPHAVNVSKNVKAARWFPQRDLLENKNVRLFITHCGISSALEAIYTSTPLIAIPFFYDQFQNAYFLSEKGVGIHIEYESLTGNELLFAINEVINNTKYRRNIQRLSQIFKDRPMSPLETAVYWIEYVLKYKEVPELRSRSADIPLYQYLLLDIIAFVLVIIISVFSISKLLIQRLPSIFWKIIRKNKLKEN